MPASEFRFVHCADVHLDTPYRSREADLRRRLEDAGRRAFRSIIDLTLDERAHALIIAGDFFDGDRLTFTTEDFIIQELHRLVDAGVTVVVTTGNHDPGNRDLRAFDIAWPGQRFHLVRERAPKQIAVRDAEHNVVGHIVACGHELAAETDNLAATFPYPPGPEPAVAVLHTQVESSLGSEAHKRYAPCTRADLAARPYQYWALGHVHTRQCVNEQPPAWYPGNSQGRHFGECGPRGALSVRIPHGEPMQPLVEFRELAPVRWEVLTLDDLVDARNLGDLKDAARAAFKTLTAAARPSQEWMVRFLLDGPCPLASDLRRRGSAEDVAEQLTRDLDILYVEVVASSLTPPVDVKGQRGRPHVLGLSLEIIDELGADDRLLDRLAPGVLAGFPDTDPEARRRYLRELLPGLDRSLVESLLRSE